METEIGILIFVVGTLFGAVLIGQLNTPYKETENE